MTQQEFIDAFQDSLSKMFNIMESKNHDYANAEDPFKNFKMAEMAGMSVEQGIFLRMLDKVSRISELLTKEAKVEDEKLEDTLLDLANYAIILNVFMANKDL